jgi:N-ethylmaleimide reductase
MPTQTEIVVRPLTSFLGAEIESVDASRAILPGVLTQLNDALIKSQLLVLRNQTLTVEQQIAFSVNFGELEQFSPHPHYPQHREIFPVSNQAEDGYLNVGHYWHHDGSFLETPTHLSLFYFLKAPLKGGDFLFTNMYLAYETLPEALKQQVESLETIHRNGVVHYGIGYPNTPGIYTAEQVAGWQQVTDAVHARGGRIFLQLWHAGRVAHPSLLPEGKLPIAPSAIPANCMADTAQGQQPHVTPRALELNEIPEIVTQFQQGAKNAIAAGFDGVEIHSANGYLLDQFLQDNSNQRSDEYGGSVENRARLLLEVVRAVVEVWGQGKVGVRVSPSSAFNDMQDSNPTATFSYVANALNPFGLAYLHAIEPRIQGNVTIAETGKGLGARFFRSIFQGSIVTAGGYNCEMGEATLQENSADFVAYGRLFLANPDLPKRFALNARLNRYDRNTFYSNGEQGYTDYPAI